MNALWVYCRAKCMLLFDLPRVRPAVFYIFLRPCYQMSGSWLRMTHLLCTPDRIPALHGATVAQRVARSVLQRLLGRDAEPALAPDVVSSAWMLKSFLILQVSTTPAPLYLPSASARRSPEEEEAPDPAPPVNSSAWGRPRTRRATPPPSACLPPPPPPANSPPLIDWPSHTGGFTTVAAIAVLTYRKYCRIVFEGGNCV